MLHRDKNSNQRREKMKKFLLFLVVLGGLTAGVAYYSNNALFESLPKTEATVNLAKETIIQHPNWKDTIVPLEGNRIRRKNGSDHGAIQNITPNTFEIVWDRWDIEIYRLNPETNIYHLEGKRKKEAK